MATRVVPMKSLPPDYHVPEDSIRANGQTRATTAGTSATRTSILGELAVGQLNGMTQATPESLALEFERLCIGGPPAKENARRHRDGLPRSSTGLTEELHAGHSPDIANGRHTTNEEQLNKHLAGQFEWVLSIPLPPGAKTERIDGKGARRHPSVSADGHALYFGCNIAQRDCRSAGGGGKREDNLSANTITLIATQIECGEEYCLAQARVEGSGRPARGNCRCYPQAMADARVISDKVGASGVAPSSEDEDIADQVATLAPMDSGSRIEDSVEALDELEEQLEAVDAVARLGRTTLSPEEARESRREKLLSPALADSTSGQDGSSSNRRASKPGASAIGAKTAGCKDPIRSAEPMVPSSRDEGPAVAKAQVKRLSVPRPASLLPPKLPAKSSKPLTVPSFELPGEAVARRLKEQREARLSLQATPTRAAAPPPKPKAKKLPTRPNFELPGEAISRRKREALEAKLRKQEEEEKKRREFKAKPVRSKLAPSALPRETIASRARQNKMASAESSTVAAPGADKRHSPAALRTNGSRLPVESPSLASSYSPSRGRGSVVGSSSTSQVSRTTSASTVSANDSIGKRSATSAESLQQQKLRGKDIYIKDNSYVTERERERREREEMAKQAREEAAERSRQTSREWKEKQRLKRAAT